jgi:hypothetical protein
MKIMGGQVGVGIQLLPTTSLLFCKQHPSLEEWAISKANKTFVTI